MTEQDVREEYVYSSSSAESIAGGSNDEDVYTEELIEAEEGNELVLVPRRENSDHVQEEVDEEALGGMGYTDCFLACVSLLKTEELIRRSPRGKQVGLLLDELDKVELEKVTEMAMLLISQASSCISSGNKHRLPSAAQASVWSTFHQRRGSPEIKQVWEVFVSNHIAESSRQESELALQLLFDRLLKRLLHNKAVAKKQSTAGTHDDSVRPLTAMESNAVRYMSGFVAVSLLKKYRKPTKHGQLKVKRALFVRVLSRMKAVDQPGEPDSVFDYTRLWSDLIDRGGLYHINDEVYHLMESIELVTRRHLNVENAQVLTPGTNIRRLIMEDVIKSKPILSHWEAIAHTIPTKYEPYSIELLQVITDLWITIRGHSFAKDWTMKFVSKYKKGTRKTLKQKQ